jgi:hypothetical protein
VRIGTAPSIRLATPDILRVYTAKGKSVSESVSHGKGNRWLAHVSGGVDGLTG